MKRSFKIENTEIDYTIKKSKRSKRLRIAVHCDASVVVTRPWWVSDKLADIFVREKINWLISRVEHFRKNKNSLIMPGSREDYMKFKKAAKILVKERLEKYNKFYGFEYKRISIKNQKTRWGSCSTKGNLNFNYKLVHLPENLADYIIVHELCHLREFNHSKNFWSLVEKTISNYKHLRRELKNKSA